MFYVKLFKNTGYNLVNVPDSIETLMSLYQAADFVVTCDNFYDCVRQTFPYLLWCNEWGCLVDDTDMGFSIQERWKFSLGRCDSFRLFLGVAEIQGNWGTF